MSVIVEYTSSIVCHIQGAIEGQLMAY